MVFRAINSFRHRLLSVSSNVNFLCLSFFDTFFIKQLLNRINLPERS